MKQKGQRAAGRRRGAGASAEAAPRTFPWKGPIWEAIRFQEEPLAKLRGAVEAGRLPHAILLWGPPGVGKLRTAQGLSQALLCEAPSRPCGICRACTKVARLLHPDVHILRPLKAREEETDATRIDAYVSNPFASLEATPPASVGIDRIRRIKEESSKTLVEGRCRTLIIPQADLMTQEAANAALKLIEEPKGETYLILTTSDVKRILPTVASRCLRVAFRPLPAPFLEETVSRAAGVPPEAARLAAALAQGSLPGSLELAGDDLVGTRDEVLDLVAPAGGDLRRVLQRAEAWGPRWNAEAARSAAGFLGLWQQDLLRLATGDREGRIIHSDRADRLRKEAEGISLGEIRRRLELLEEMVEAVETYVNPQLALRAFLMAWETGEMSDRMFRPIEPQ